MIKVNGTDPAAQTEQSLQQSLLTVTSYEMDSGYMPHSHVPYGSDGSGFYTDNTIGCFNVVQAGTPLTLTALDAATPKKTSLVTVCDYGTADGGISVFLMKDIIAFVKKKHGEDTQISILYEDQPINDFKSLFLRIHGLLPGPTSYLKDYSGVFISAIGTGFYDQCVPSNTVDLGFSSTAIHWLTKRPGTLTGALHHTEATVAEEKRMFADQAAKDYELFLLQRAKELKHGGQMVIISVTQDRNGHFLGSTDSCKQSMFHNMTRLWQLMVDEGKITKEEFQNTNFNNYYRTEKEYSSPFEDADSPVSKAGLKLVSIETKHVRCPYHVKWMKEGNKDDPEAAKRHAEWFIPTTRTWSNSTFFSGLSETRATEERNALVDELFSRYEAEVAANPQDHAMDFVHAFIHIAKQ